MKRKNFYIILFGLILILCSLSLFFRNSNKKLDINNLNNKINDLQNDVNKFEVTDKIENTREYEVKLSEIRLSVNLLDSSNYELFLNKEISLYDYFINNKKIKKYNEKIDNIEKVLEQKLK